MAMIAAAPTTAVAFRPDLSVTAVAVKGVGTAGQRITVTATVRNAGPAAADFRYHLLREDDVDGAETMALGSVAELDEANDAIESAPLTVVPFRPDLTVTAVRPVGVAAVGRPLSGTGTVRNNGPARASAFDVRFYLSADGILDGDDVPLGSRQIAGLAPRPDVGGIHRLDDSSHDPTRVLLDTFHASTCAPRRRSGERPSASRQTEALARCGGRERVIPAGDRETVSEPPASGQGQREMNHVIRPERIPIGESRDLADELAGDLADTEPDSSTYSFTNALVSR